MIEYVKICGLKEFEHVDLCAQNGANAVGFVYNVPTSPRNLKKDEIKKLLQKIENKLITVIVFKPSSVEEIDATMNNIPASLYQVHPDFDLNDLKSLSLYKRKKIILALKINQLNKNYIIDVINSYSDQVFSFLLDNSEGEGCFMDLDLVREALKRSPGAKIILAGGINEFNVESLANSLNPFGVDASSSLESEKGVKSITKIKAFLNVINKIKNRSE
ncbi:MAG: phosphoribosylanthranilate isomerase [Candidatus Lokiarchaeota archaeon]|nr:phosphoribosylanthranilate isomerase [Candidatus Lokiarchaeota archaeon]